MEADILPVARRQDWMTRIGIKVFRYKGLFKRHWWLPLLTVSCGLAWQGWNLFSTPVRYESEGRLIVTQSLNLPDDASSHDDPDEFYGTQLRLL